MISGVVFDLDGVLLDSEQLWDEARRTVVAAHGGRWRPEATADMQGMSSTEWSAYMRESLGLGLDVARINELVVRELLRRFEGGLPLLPGAAEAVRRLGSRWPLALASSANREVIDTVLQRADLTGEFAATVSSEEVPRGKPAPDVYVEAARRLGRRPHECVAVEDSENGIRSAAAAGLGVVAIPNRHYPPPPGVLRQAALVVSGLDQLTVDVVERAFGGGGGGRASLSSDERLDEQEIESFPASDPHSDWAGPPG